MRLRPSAVTFPLSAALLLWERMHFGITAGGKRSLQLAKRNPAELTGRQVLAFVYRGAELL
jgi:hypothetical protein